MTYRESVRIYFFFFFYSCNNGTSDRQILLVNVFQIHPLLIELNNALCETESDQEQKTSEMFGDY